MHNRGKAMRDQYSNGITAFGHFANRLADLFLR
jgi:hypothetical protein